MDTKVLRQKILDLAIRGKLVPQDPADEPASVLLERIRTEKEALIKEGKIKRDKNESVIFKGEDGLHYEKFNDGSVKCIEDEIPFELPEGWEWTRLKHICMMVAGKTKSSDQIKTKPFDGCYPCFGGNGIRGYVDEYNQEGTFALVGRQGALCGNINIASGKFYATEHAIVTTLFCEIDFNWNYFTLVALRLNEYATGAAQPGLSVANVLNVFVPVPPNSEQKRIGKRITELLSLIDSIEKEKSELKTIINNAKARVLDLAIRGKLVPQDPADEPASLLLGRIHNEKLKLVKEGKLKAKDVQNDTGIFKGEDGLHYEKFSDGSVKCIEDEIPFELPQGWEWTRGFNCLLKMESIKPSGEYFDYIDIDAIDNKNHRISTPKHLLSKNAPSRASRKVSAGDTLFSLVRPYLENIAFVTKKHGNCIASTGFYVCSSNGALYPMYLFRLMTSSYTIDGLNKFMKGDNSPSIHADDIENWLFPLPPLAEQRRIVEAIEKYFALLDELAAAVA